MSVNMFGEKRKREREREKDAAMGEQGERKFLSFSVCVCVFRRNAYLRYPYRSYIVSKSLSACIRVYNKHRSSCKPPVLDSVVIVVESICLVCLKQEKNKRKTKGKNKGKQGGKISLVRQTRKINFPCLPNKGN